MYKQSLPFSLRVYFSAWTRFVKVCSDVSVVLFIIFFPSFNIIYHAVLFLIVFYFYFYFYFFFFFFFFLLLFFYMYSSSINNFKTNK